MKLACQAALPAQVLTRAEELIPILAAAIKVIWWPRSSLTLILLLLLPKVNPEDETYLVVFCLLTAAAASAFRLYDGQVELFAEYSLDGRWPPYGLDTRCVAA